MVGALIIAGLQLYACRQKSDTPDALRQFEAAKAEYTGEAIYRVRLTASKAKEYNLKTAPVREEQVSGTLRKVIPSTAVVHDPDGNTWTFACPESLVFIRKPVRVDHMAGDMVVLSEGPPAGTEVVTAGAAKLFASEFMEIGKRGVESSTAGGGNGKKPAGTATMKEDGTIRLVYRTEGAAGLGASVVIEYKPNDEEYQKILDQVGGLKVGETKSVPPWPDK
jgi:hypothetical protein